MSRAECALRAHEALSASRALVAESRQLIDRVRTDRQNRQAASWRRAAALSSSATLRRRRAARLRARFQIRHPAELVRRAARLTSREEEVLALVAHGYTNAAIGGRLDIAENTVASYRRRGMEKIGAGRVSELVCWASDAGLFPNPDA